MDLGLIIYALNLASIYALMAIGISILWSSIGMINMAHGASFAISGYAAWLAAAATKPMIAAAFKGTIYFKLVTGVVTFSAAISAGAISGLIIYLLAFLPLHDKSNYSVRSLIVTLALNLATVQLLLTFFGPRQKALPKVFGFGRFEVWGAKIRFDQLGTIVSTAVILGLVLLWLRVSRKGLEIRAMMQNPEGAGLAAVLLSQTIFVSPTAGAIPLIKGLTIALLGGLGSIRILIIAAVC